MRWPLIVVTSCVCAGWYAPLRARVDTNDRPERFAHADSAGAVRFVTEHGDAEQRDRVVAALRKRDGIRVRRQTELRKSAAGICAARKAAGRRLRRDVDVGERRLRGRIRHGGRQVSLDTARRLRGLVRDAEGRDDGIPATGHAFSTKLTRQCQAEARPHRRQSPRTATLTFCRATVGQPSRTSASFFWTHFSGLPQRRTDLPDTISIVADGSLPTLGAYVSSTFVGPSTSGAIKRDDPPYILLDNA